MQRLGQHAGRDLVLLRVVEAAAVDAPVLAGDACVAVGALVHRREAEVEPDEVERRADPGDPGDHVQEPQAEVGDVLQVVRVHRSLAISTSSRTPVSSSSSRVRASRSRSTSRISAFGRRFDEDDEAEAELLLVDLVEVRELGEDRRIGVRALLGGRPLGEVPRADRRVRLSASICSSSGRPRSTSSARPSGSSQLGEPLDEARAALEELAELFGAQLPR